MIRTTFLSALMAASLVLQARAAGPEQAGQPVDPESAKVMTVYFVGHSLVRSITPTRLHELVAQRGIDLQFGSQLKGGFSLTKHWEVLEKGEAIRYWESNKPAGDRFEPGRPDGDTLPKRFGSFWTAHKNHDWDALVLVPLLGADREKEFAAFAKFVDYAIEHQSANQIYVFQSWLGLPVLRDENGRRAGLGRLDFATVWEGESAVTKPSAGGPLMAVQRDYYEFMDRANQHFAQRLSKPVLMIPFGDVVCELDKRLKAGTIPGLDELYRRDPDRIPSWDPKVGAKVGANIFYADRLHPVAQPHLDGTIATYVMGLMYYSVLTGDSPVGLSGDAYRFGHEADEELRHALQTAVWDVVKDHPYTGVQAKTANDVSASRPTGKKKLVQKLKSGSISVARWKDEKTAAVTIFSGDGMIRSIKSRWTPENPNVPYDGFYRLGEEYSIPFTFFLPPRGLDEPSYVAASGVTPPAQPAGSLGTWADWKHMHEAGYEIASHTYSHADLRPSKSDESETRSGLDPTYELQHAIVAIQKNIGIRPISINPAFGPPAGQLLGLFRKFYPVVRGDDDAEVVLAQHRDTATAEELIGRLDVAIEEHKWLLVAGHGLRTELGRQEEAAPDFAERGKRWDGYKPVEYPVMAALCNNIDQRRSELFVGCFGDVGRYIRERNAARITIISETEDRIVLDVTHRLDPNVFDLPLTLKLSLIGTVNLAGMSQDGKRVKVMTRGRDALFNVVPNGGPVTIKIQ